MTTFFTIRKGSDQYVVADTHRFIWVFTRHTMRVPYWLVLHREGFSGPGLFWGSHEFDSFISELRFTGLNDHPNLDSLLRLIDHNPAPLPVRYSINPYHDDVKKLKSAVMSGSLAVYRLDERFRWRVLDSEDTLWATSSDWGFSQLPDVAARDTLAQTLAELILLRWDDKIESDRAYFALSFWQHKKTDLLDQGEAVLNAGASVIGSLFNLGKVVCHAVDETLSFTLQTAGNLATADINEIKADLSAAGIALDKTIDNAGDLLSEAKRGLQILNTLMQDQQTAYLLMDFLDAYYQSMPYRQTKTLQTRVIAEIGIEVLLALATTGLITAAHRGAQAARAANKSAKANHSNSNTIGPFTRQAIAQMKTLYHTLRQQGAGAPEVLPIKTGDSKKVTGPVKETKKPGYQPKEGVKPLVGDTVHKRHHPDGRQPHPDNPMDRGDPYTLQADGKPMGAKEGVMPANKQGLKELDPEHQRLIDEEGYPDVAFDEDYKNFSDIKPTELKEGDTIYRIIDEGSSEAKGTSGTYWARELPENKTAWRSDYAVKDSWNDNGYYVEHTVGSEGMKVWEGTTAGQNYDIANGKQFYLEGGEQQLYIDRGSVNEFTPQSTNWSDAN